MKRLLASTLIGLAVLASAPAAMAAELRLGPLHLPLPPFLPPPILLPPGVHYQGDWRQGGYGGASPGTMSGSSMGYQYAPQSSFGHQTGYGGQVGYGSRGYAGDKEQSRFHESLLELTVTGSRL